MASAVGQLLSPAPALRGRAVTESLWVRCFLILLALVFLGLFLLVPLIQVFFKALESGIGYYFQAIWQPDTRSAIRLTLITAGITVPLNLLFGLTASWSIAKFNFPGKHFLITLIDLPFSVSPVISGMIYVLLF